MNQTNGIHHITAIAGNPQQNYEFYTQVLGLRLVKKTVNFDDPTTYHLYYGNESGEAGTILTFFPWEHLHNGKPDRGQAVAVSFSVPTASKQFWIDRLKKLNLNPTELFKRFGDEMIGLQDPDGLHLELVFDSGADDVSGWNAGAVPAQHAIRGIYGATLAEKNYAPTGNLLEEDLGFDYAGQSDNRHRYQSNARFGSIIEIIDQFGPSGQSGKGTVHHIAFRAADDRRQEEIGRNLFNKGYHLTEVKDRHYFKSVYFHEPGGILFEIATDGPGFTADEALESLGSALKLPSELEELRHRIEAELPELVD